MAGILVTRAQPQAEETARMITALGLTPILAPLRKVVSLESPPPARPDTLVATSANAFSGASIPSDWLALPLYCVGTRSAEAAREAGFLNVMPGPGTAEDIVEAVIAAHPPGSQLVYLAGEPRREAIEHLLDKAGIRVDIWLRYRMEAVSHLPEAARAALATGTCGAVLHYSAESAATFFSLAAAAGLGAEAKSPKHLCLSFAILQQISQIAGAGLDIAAAATPDAQGMTALLARVATDLTQCREIG